MIKMDWDREIGLLMVAFVLAMFLAMVAKHFHFPSPLGIAAATLVAWSAVRLLDWFVYEER